MCLARWLQSCLRATPLCGRRMPSASGGLITERTLFSLFQTLAADSVRHRLLSTSRVNAALSRCFMLESLSIWARIIRWERASGCVFALLCCWVESRAAVRATPVHEPWALAASNLSCWHWGSTEMKFAGEMDAGEEHSTSTLGTRPARLDLLLESCRRECMNARHLDSGR